MSHFTVLVVRDPELTLEDQMAPFHEFECTGDNNEYVQDVDVTDEMRQEFESQSDEDYPTFLSFLENYHEIAQVAAGDDPDINGEHQFSYFRTNDQGEVVKVVRRTNPNRHWDWYQVGGRWSGFFDLKNGRKADSALKKDIDFEGRRSRAAASAGAWYDEVHAVIAGRAIPNWDQFRTQFDSIDDARTEYHAHPVMQDVKKLKSWDFFTDIEDFDCTREAFTQRARDNAMCTFALLKEGVWYERGEMLMFGMSANEKDPELWSAQVAQILDELPEDTELTLVDCHI